MRRRIKVGTPYKPIDRKFYYVQWTDPLTAKPVTRSTKCVKQKDAVRFAAELEVELNDRRSNTVPTTWSELAERYKADCFPSQRLKTRKKTETTIKAVYEVLGPINTLELTTADILRFKSAIRKRDVSEFTVKGHLAEFRKILRWAARNGMLAEMPNFEMPDVSELTTHPPGEGEFQLMLKSAAEVVGEKAAPSWRHLIEGLWWSGLRISEAILLRWSSAQLANMWVDLEVDPPMFRIAASFDKKGRDRTFPIAPEFCEMLRAIPPEQRNGYVFNPMPWGESTPDERPCFDRVVKTIGMIGEKAQVVTAEKRRQLSTRTKFASAHDLRRSFGARWAQRLLPPALMEMMRHESVQSVMKFYVGRNAAVAGRQAWDEYTRINQGAS